MQYWIWEKGDEIGHLLPGVYYEKHQIAKYLHSRQFQHITIRDASQVCIIMECKIMLIHCVLQVKYFKSVTTIKLCKYK